MIDKRNQGGGKFCHFRLLCDSELSLHPRPMVRKGKFQVYLKKTCQYRNCHQKPPFTTKLYISESFEINLLFLKNPLDFAFDTFLKKKSWSQMIQKCLIRQMVVTVLPPFFKIYVKYVQKVNVYLLLQLV